MTDQMQEEEQNQKCCPNGDQQKVYDEFLTEYRDAYDLLRKYFIVPVTEPLITLSTNRERLNTIDFGQMYTGIEYGGDLKGQPDGTLGKMFELILHFNVPAILADFWTHYYYVNHVYDTLVISGCPVSNMKKKLLRHDVSKLTLEEVIGYGSKFFHVTDFKCEIPKRDYAELFNLMYGKKSEEEEEDFEDRPVVVDDESHLFGLLICRHKTEFPVATHRQEKPCSEYEHPLWCSALKHHYEHNPHHPEHHGTGVPMGRENLEEALIDGMARQLQFKSPPERLTLDQWLQSPIDYQEKINPRFCESDFDDIRRILKHWGSKLRKMDVHVTLHQLNRKRYVLGFRDTEKLLE